MPGPRLALSLILAVAVLVLPAVAAEAESLAGQGTISGSVKSVPPAKKPFFAAQARVMRLDSPGSLRVLKVSTRGRFSTKVPTGLYAVVTSGHGATRPKQRSDVLTVRAGRTSAFAGRQAAIARTRVSVGKIALGSGISEPEAAYFVAGLTDLSITDIVQATERCRSKVGIYEDRKHGRFDEILKELKFQTTRHFSPETRRAARAALKNLPNHAPNLRVTGVLTSMSGDTATATFRAVDTRTRTSTWSATVSGAPLDLSTLAMDKLAEQLCTGKPPAPTYPATLAGSLSGSVTKSAYALTWEGTVSYAHQPVDPYTGFAWGDGQAHYEVTAAALAWRAAGTCNGSGSLSLAQLQGVAYLDLVRSAPGWGYEVHLSPVSGTQMVAQCPPDEDGRPVSVNTAYDVGLGGGGALLYSSDTRGAEANRYTPDLTAFAGSLSINPGFAQSWTWNLTGTGAVTIESQ